MKFVIIDTKFRFCGELNLYHVLIANIQNFMIAITDLYLSINFYKFHSHILQIQIYINRFEDLFKIALNRQKVEKGGWYALNVKEHVIHCI